MKFGEQELGFYGISTFCKFPHTRDLDGVQVSVIGVPMDQATTCRAGTRNGPRSIRQASQFYGMCYSHEEGIYDIESGKNILAGVKVIDYGDVQIGPVELEKNFRIINEYLQKIVDSGVFPVTLGGDHSITYPVVKAFKDIPLDIVHFDTHLDFLDNAGEMQLSHANPIKRISELPNVNRITQIGIRGLANPLIITEEALKYGSNIITANKVIKNGTAWTIDQIPKAENIYVTIDIDVLDPSLAPGTGTPEPGGLNYIQLKEILNALPEKGNIVGFDLVEVNPLYDEGEVTSQVAARLVLDFLGAIMEEKRK